MERKVGNLLSHPVGSVVLALLSQMIWGSAFALIKLAYSDFSITTVGDTFLFVGLRMFVAGLILFVIAVVSGHKVPSPDKSEIGTVFAIGTLQIGVVYALQFSGMINTSSVHCSILNGSQIITTTLFAHLFFKDDHINLKKGVGCIIAFVGVLFCFLYGGQLGSFSLKGEGVFFLSCTTFALCSSLVRKFIRKTNPIVYTCYSILLGGIELLILGFVCGGKLGAGGLRGWAILAVLALISSMCFLVWNALVKSNPINRISVCQCVNPITGAVLSSILLGENVLQTRYVVAIVLIVLGIVVINTSTQKAH